MKNLKKILIIVGVLWIAIIFYFTGYLIGHKNLILGTNYKPTITNLELKKPESVDFGIFWKAWNTISDKYVGTYSAQKLVYGAIKGMTEALGDPYSNFLDQTENTALQQDLSGKFEGIGAELSKKDGKIIIIAPLGDSPAEKAGLKAQDQILGIDGKDISNLSLDEAVSKIRGAKGTEVTLLINRQGFQTPQEFKITRGLITVSSVKWEMKGEIGYIQITQFGSDTSELAKKAASELAQKKPKAIVLDLRNNPGGYLDSAVDVSSLFVPKGSVVVKEQYKDGHKDELKTTFEPILKDYKVIVLVNEGSASASEIVAGALQDLRGATLIGKKTFGKGSVQELQNLDTSAVLKLTIAKWLTPNDRTIDKEGIKPNIEVDRTETDQSQNLDPQLDKALEEAGK
ncbi:MAG: S41 family peptidase [Patescibacteria group bacterium]|nr:S41 family peptidase [Patescibacteria group bacterium]